MSRHCFIELFKNENIDDFRAVKDVFGNSIQDWIERGSFGYDRPLSTYFLQLESKGEDSCDVWYGANFGEIRSPYIIVAIIEKIFKRNIKYNEQVVDLLVKERNHSYQDRCDADTVINELNAWDETCKMNRNITNDYIKSGFFEKNN